MTEYEIASLYSDYSLNLFVLFTIYYSVIFAFVLTSYFVARDLSQPMAWLATTLFSVTMSLAVFQQWLLVVSNISLAKKIGAFAALPSSDLQWHAMATAPTWLLDIVPWAFNAANMTIFCGALYFFFACRRGRFGVKK